MHFTSSELGTALTPLAMPFTHNSVRPFGSQDIGMYQVLRLAPSVSCIAAVAWQRVHRVS